MSNCAIVPVRATSSPKDSRALDELQGEARARLRARPEVARGAEHDRLGELLATVGPGEAHAGRAQRRGERVEVVDLERHVIEALRRAFKAARLQIGVGEQEQLERAEALAQEDRVDVELRDRAGSRHLEPEGFARVRGREVEIVDDHPDVVEAAEHDARSYTG